MDDANGGSGFSLPDFTVRWMRTAISAARFFMSSSPVVFNMAVG